MSPAKSPFFFTLHLFYRKDVFLWSLSVDFSEGCAVTKVFRKTKEIIFREKIVRSRYWLGRRHLDEIISLLKEFVERNSNIKDISFDPNIPPRLHFDPYSQNCEEKRKIAHYLLLVASISEGNVIGRAEHARRLIVNLYNKFGETLFKIDEPQQFQKEIVNSKFYTEFGQLKHQISHILTSVNKFVVDIARNNLIEYSQNLSKPKEMIVEIGKHVIRMGGPIQAKACIYLRWMVRPYPDLKIFENFSPQDLYVPLTTDILRVASCLGIIENIEGPFFWEHVEKVTNLARTIFPGDPAKVDYPFFLVGRWLRGKELNIQTLKDTLVLLDAFYKKTGYSILLTKEKVGFSAECPALLGAITQGETEQEVLKNMEEAIAAYLEATKSQKEC